MPRHPARWLLPPALAATSACTFHPEYHPVSVRQITQTVSVPASGLAAAGGPVLAPSPSPSSPWWRDTGEDDDE
jgi:hypothetical protein